jgi:predicted nucleotidyltransferase component of viral defense system
MIAEETYQINWIKNISSGIGKRGDPKILEKVIYAFILLEQLRKQRLNLIFKGGTSLLLTISKPRRFSIDIDIITLEQKAKIEEILGSVVKDSPFTRWESDNNRTNYVDAPVIHYKLFGAKLQSLRNATLPEHYIHFFTKSRFKNFIQC